MAKAQNVSAGIFGHAAEKGTEERIVRHIEAESVVAYKQGMEKAARLREECAVLSRIVEERETAWREFGSALESRYGMTLSENYSYSEKDQTLYLVLTNGIAGSSPANPVMRAHRAFVSDEEAARFVSLVTERNAAAERMNRARMLLKEKAIELAALASALRDRFGVVPEGKYRFDEKTSTLFSIVPLPTAEERRHSREMEEQALRDARERALERKREAEARARAEKERMAAEKKAREMAEKEAAAKAKAEAAAAKAEAEAKARAEKERIAAERKAKDEAEARAKAEAEAEALAKKGAAKAAKLAKEKAEKERLAAERKAKEEAEAKAKAEAAAAKAEAEAKARAEKEAAKAAKLAKEKAEKERLAAERKAKEEAEARRKAERKLAEERRRKWEEELRREREMEKRLYR